jgi:ubiquinone/menaquinone biosynthesis C-methylase UbiE
MTALAWDYTNLAAYYDKRADYEQGAIDALLKAVDASPLKPVADIGAGTGKLTKLLLKAGLTVNAVEPNAEMMKFGKQNTAGGRVTWYQATGEHTSLPDACVSLVTFGSSFNVGDRAKTLQEVKRISTPGSWFACMWNHRDLDDSVQKDIEAIIKRHIPGYDYGTRREDQTAYLQESGMFGDINTIEGTLQHTLSREDSVEAWRSHGTLERQAGAKFKDIIADIESYMADKPVVTVPYTTRIWYAQLKA